MADFDLRLTRRSALVAMASVVQARVAFAAEEPSITVHKDPSCGCCSGWVQHVQKAGFVTKVFDTNDIDAVKKRLGVPDDLAACHTAEVAGYVIEGHVPAAALRRFLAEKPQAKGLPVPGMPIGSPGMEGGKPEKYDVVLFGPAGRRTLHEFYRRTERLSSARAASGHATAPPSNVMNSRRLTARCLLCFRPKA